MYTPPLNISVGIVLPFRGEYGAGFGAATIDQGDSIAIENTQQVPMHGPIRENTAVLAIVVESPTTHRHSSFVLIDILHDLVGPAELGTNLGEHRDVLGMKTFQAPEVNFRFVNENPHRPL